MNKVVMVVLLSMLLVVAGCADSQESDGETVEIRESAVSSTLRTGESTLNVEFYPKEQSDKAVILYQNTDVDSAVWSEHIPRLQRVANTVVFTSQDQDISVDVTLQSLLGFLDRRDIATQSTYLVLVDDVYENDDLALIVLIGDVEPIRNNQVAFDKTGDTFGEGVRENIISLID